MAIDFNRSYYSYVYPSELLVTQLNKVYKNTDTSGKKALDFGFGGGRHVSLLNNMNFDTYGLDITNDAKDTMISIFGNIISDDKIIIADILKEPNIFSDNFFDLIISFSSLYNRTYSQVDILIAKFSKLLKKDAIFISNFKTKFDSEYTNAKELIEENTITASNNLDWTFLDDKDLNKLLRKHNFSIINIERHDRHVSGKCLSYWICSAKKEC